MSLQKEKCRCSQSEGKHMLMGCSCPCHSQSESIELSLQKESEGKLITAMGMMAENMQRQALGESMAYIESDFVNLLEDHKCGGDLCIVCGYREKIKESEWEKQLKECEDDFIADIYGPEIAKERSSNGVRLSFQKHVSRLLSTREKEIAEEVEKLKRETLHEKHNETGDPCWKCKYDQGKGHAYQDVLSILKH